MQFTDAILDIIQSTIASLECKKYGISGLQIECVIKNHFFHFSTKTYVVGTRKNCLNETVLLNTRNICLN